MKMYKPQSNHFIYFRNFKHFSSHTIQHSFKKTNFDERSIGLVTLTHKIKTKSYKIIEYAKVRFRNKVVFF